MFDSYIVAGVRIVLRNVGNGSVGCSSKNDRVMLRELSMVRMQENFCWLS